MEGGATFAPSLGASSLATQGFFSRLNRLKSDLEISPFLVVFLPVKDLIRMA